MLFNSLVFPAFLAVVLPVYYCLSRRAQNAWLLIASYVFYGWWDWRFLSLIAISTVLDFFVGQRIHRTGDQARRRRYLHLSVAGNLGILGLFKYFGFFAASFEAALGSLGLAVHAPTLQVVLPVGISFYTFQTLSYTLDIYRRKTEPTTDFVAFALFVAYFPQLVAGPIERARNLLPRLVNPRRVAWPGIAVGVELILIGFLKKVAVADVLGPLVDVRVAKPELTSGADLLLCVFLFSFQIYADFSGYSDIARGTSRLFGIPLMRNFEQPYLSRSISEFWRRWHISLSTWLRDYLYISLGGNRKGPRRTYANLMVTMLLGGLWHGASWTFVIWGGLHGIYLAMDKVRLRSARVHESTVSDLLRWLMTFGLVSFTWVFFRAADFATAWAWLVGIVRWQQGAAMMQPLGWLGPRVLVVAGILILIDLYQARRGDHAVFVSWPWLPRAAVYAGLVLVVAVLGNTDGAVPFIYFQF